MHPTAQHAECGDLRSHLHKSLHLACVLQVALEVYDMQGHVFQNDYDLGDSKSAAQKPPQPPSDWVRLRELPQANKVVPLSDGPCCRTRPVCSSATVLSWMTA